MADRAQGVIPHLVVADAAAALAGVEEGWGQSLAASGGTWKA